MCMQGFVKYSAEAILLNGFEACKRKLIEFETLQSEFH
jgi:hypothetical protein